MRLRSQERLLQQQMKGRDIMVQARKISALGLIALTPIFSLVLAAQAGDPLMAIQQKLKTQIKLTRTLADRSDIVTPGSVVELHVDGLMMYGVESPLAPSNTYKNGKIGRLVLEKIWRSGCREMAPTPAITRTANSLKGKNVGLQQSPPKKMEFRSSCSAILTTMSAFTQI